MDVEWFCVGLGGGLMPTNLLDAATSGFEDVSVGSWTSTEPANYVLSPDVGAGHTGSVSMLVETLNNDWDGLLSTPTGVDGFSVSSGATLSYSGWYNRPGTSNADLTLAVVFFDASGDLVGSDDVTVREVFGGWHQLVGETTVPTGAVFAALQVTIAHVSAPLSPEYRRFDDFFVSQEVSVGGWGVGMVRMGAN